MFHCKCLILLFSKHRLHRVIKHDLEDGFSTNIKSGLEMAIGLFRNRQGENPISALFLLTDGQDDEIHDYSQTMRQVPTNVICHTFGYGPDHAAALLVKIAESGNDGTFTYIVSLPENRKYKCSRFSIRISTTLLARHLLSHWLVC